MASLSLGAKKALLAEAPLFRGLSGRELERIASLARVEDLKKRDALCHKGDEGAQVYLIARGKLKAVTHSTKGDDVVFSIQGPGEVVGEISLLGDTPRTATLTAIEPCQILVIDRRDFFAFVREHPDAAVTLLRTLAQRVMKLSELVEDTLFLNLPVRLAKKLWALARTYGEESETGLRVDLKLSQEEWGALIGATRESVNKQVRAWTDEGLISVQGGYIVIHRPAELEKMAGAVLI